MRVTCIELRDFRNYEAAEVELSEDLTVVTGANGAGKTNLLEALNAHPHLRLRPDGRGPSSPRTQARRLAEQAEGRGRRDATPIAHQTFRRMGMTR